MGRARPWRAVARRCAPAARTIALPDALPICVIDDDESVRLSLDGLLRSLGYTVQCFACAEDFLASPAHRACACVISDIQMPRMTGIDLFAALKARRIATPFIFITAFSDEKTRARASECGNACFLAKPFDAAALIACLERTLAAAP